MADLAQTIKTAEDIRKFADDINLELDRCDNGEGMECASLDTSLEHYARRCCLMTDQIKRWGREVFAGRVPYDPRVDDAWRDAGVSLNNRAVEMLDRAQLLEIPCYDLPGADKLRGALFGLHQVLNDSIKAQLSVGPSARGTEQRIPHAEAAKQRIAGLRALPKGWLPPDGRQRSVFRKTSKT